MTIQQNTLDIIDMTIMKTSKFFNDLQGQTITIWTMDGGLYMIENFNKALFVEKGVIFPNDAIVLKSGSYRSGFSIECHRGFGITPTQSDKSYWVDKVNSEDIAVIVYKRHDYNNKNEEVQP
jgi:hypothetical protein